MKNVQSITKGVIPAAGLGKRFWPVTKIIPKELLPIVTKPSIHMVLEEANHSGLKDIVLIVALAKKSFFDHLHDFFPQMNFHFVEQREPFGLGHAVGLAEKKVEEEPFVVLLPDVIIDHETTVTQQLIQNFQTIQKSVCAAERVPKEKVHLYGVYDIASSEGKLHKAKGVIEKPNAEKAPSDLGVAGRYLFTPDIFPLLTDTKPGYGGEIQLADAMNILAKREALYAYEFEGRHFDIGHPQGFIQAIDYYGKKEYGNGLD